MGFTITRLPDSVVFVVRGHGDGHVGEAQELLRVRRPPARAAEAGP
jgi:hypothetical protein